MCTFLSKTDKIRVAHYRVWRQIDIIGYLNGSTSSKFVSSSFKSFTSGAECTSMWLLCSYRINSNISCWLIKTLSSKYNTSINLVSSSFYPRKVALVWYVAVLGYCICRTKRKKSGTKIRDQNFEDSEKALDSDFSQRLPTSVAICINGDRWPPTRWSIWYRSVPMATRPLLVTNGSLGCRR